MSFYLKTREILYILYMFALLLDDFKFLIIFTLLLIILGISNWAKKLSKMIIFFQILLALIAVRCQLSGFIPEAKFFIIYIFSLNAGLIFSPSILKFANIKNYIFIGFFGLLILALRNIGINFSPEINTEELLNNYAELVLFNVYALIYCSRKSLKYHRIQNIILAIFSGSKFLIINSFVIGWAKKWYPLIIISIIFNLFLINPNGALSSRISLYEIFIQNLNINNFLFGDIKSVNSLVILEETIYSFHDIWMDYIWYGGIIGIAAIISQLFLMRKIYKVGQSINQKNIVIFYLICVTCGFSVFFGTKYMMLMLGVFLAERRMLCVANCKNETKKNG